MVSIPVVEHLLKDYSYRIGEATVVEEKALTNKHA
jgi:hypothetical protein